MKRHLMSAAVAAIAIAGAPGAASAAITLSVETSPPGVNEANTDSCIFGNPSLNCASEYLLYSGAPGGTETDREHAFTVGQIRSIVGDSFSVGIDSNSAAGQPDNQVLTKFELWNADTNTPLYVVDVPAELDPAVAQGTGFSDYIINGYNLAGLADETRVFFRLSLEELSAGAEQFFFVEAPEEIPVPAAVWLMGAGLAGLGFAGRKSKMAHGV